MSGSAPRPPKTAKAPAPAPKALPKPFSEREQLALAKVLRAKSTKGKSIDGDTEADEAKE